MPISRTVVCRPVKAEGGIIVEIDARALARTYGTMSHVPVEFWDFIAKLGTSIIWLKCPWQESPLSFALMQKYSQLHHEVLPGEDPVGIAGGYDVFKYKLNPKVAQSDKEFITVVNRLRSMGMTLILDFVTNHIAADSPYITKVPGLVRVHGDRTFQHALGAENLAEINYLDERARRFMIDVVLDKIARLTQNGGLRADLAHLALRLVVRDFCGFDMSWEEFARRMPQEFWQEFKQAVDQRYPGMPIFAETYGKGNIETLVNLGLKPYNKDPYDLLAAGDVPNLRGYLFRATPEGMQQWSRFLAQCVNCTENHDEPAGPETLGTGAHVRSFCHFVVDSGLQVDSFKTNFGYG